MSPTECRDGDILLYNGTTLSTEHSNGTVLLCHDNKYHTVCDDFWDILDAKVVCTHLGFEPTGNVVLQCMMCCSVHVSTSLEIVFKPAIIKLYDAFV